MEPEATQLVPNVSDGAAWWIQVAGDEFPIRTVRTRSERLKYLVDRAYLEKYHTPASIKFARDLGRAKSKATTTELVLR